MKEAQRLAEEEEEKLRELERQVRLSQNLLC